MSPDANSTYWNAAKLPYNTKDFGASASYTPWLRNLVDDMWLGYLTAYKKLGDKQAVAFSVNYFNNGELDLAYCHRYSKRLLSLHVNLHLAERTHVSSEELLDGS